MLFFARSTKHTARQLGFTLIEILVVATIIIVLSTIGMVSYQQAGVRARNGKRRADMETVRQSLVLYRTDNLAYPSGSDFNTMIGTINDYVSATQITDHKNVDSYVYAYNSADGKTFTLTWYEEPSATANSISNP